MKKPITFILLLHCTLLFAQNRVERIGLAVSGYYGSSVFLKIISEGSCKKYMRIDSSEYNLYLLRSSINENLKLILSRSDYKGLQDMYEEGEKDIRKDNIFPPNIPESKCQDLVDEITKMHASKKLIWNNSLK